MKLRRFGCHRHQKCSVAVIVRSRVWSASGGTRLRAPEPFDRGPHPPRFRGMGSSAACWLAAAKRTQENSNGTLSSLSSDGWGHGLDQRQKDQDDSEGGHVPDEGAQQKNACRVQGEIGDATPKIELDTPFGHPTVRRRNMRN